MWSASYLSVIYVLPLTIFFCLSAKERIRISKEYDQDVKRLYESSLIRDDGRSLVLFLYASNKELRLVRMHPDFCAADTTFGTNDEKKELFTLAFKDGNKKLLMVVDVLFQTHKNGYTECYSKIVYHYFGTKAYVIS